MSDCIELRQRQQALRDQIWLYGPEHFNMSYWGGVQGLGHGLSLSQVACGRLDLTQCGTTACLLGHATVLDPFLAHMTEHGAAVHLGFDSDDVFYTHLWKVVRLSDGTTLNERVYDYLDDGDTWPVAEWRTVIDLLDDRIKHTECDEEVRA